MLTHQDVIARLVKRIGKTPQKVIANEIGISQSYLSDILNGKREPGNAVQKFLGIRRKVIYTKEGK